MNDRSSDRSARRGPDLPEDPAAERIAADLARLASTGPRVAADLARRQGRGDFFTLPDPAVVARSLATLWEQMARHPEQMLEVESRLWRGYLDIWEGAARRMLGLPAQPVAQPAEKDRRFAAEAWTQNLWLDALKQTYLLNRDAFLETTESVTGELDAHERAKVRFYARQLADALAPGNSPALNPDVLEATLRSGGENLLRGAANLLADLARGEGLLRIRQTDLKSLELGRDLAATPGRVVYQNRLMQLIQYQPATEQVDRRPLLIVPPWINKYYILDLVPKRSFVRWAVNQGLTVFVISWVNPDESYADTPFDDYLTDGTLAALDAVEQATGEREVNAVGYCIGGTLLSCTLAHEAARGEQRIRSATLFTTLLEFSEVGELSVFIDEEQIRGIERHMEQRGYLEGTHLANAFNLLQANDLIWGFVVTNYLLGRDPPAFDLLYWNSDSTRMPRRMHSYYLRRMYLENRLREPGALRLAGQPIDLGAIRVPAFCLATRGDHIALWPSCYRSARLLGGPTRFVLGGSGHIAGVINPEGSPKYGYWTNARQSVDPERWLAGAEHHDGSWWPEWRRWVARHAGGQTAARVPGDGALPPLEDAPGSYVRVRIDGPDGPGL